MERAKTILLIEDQPEFVEAMTGALEYGGYAVVSAATGLEALRYLDTADELPRLILLDLQLPGMSGMEFLRHQRARPAVAAVPVVLVSSERNLARRAAEVGAAAYLRKPVELDRLLATVRRLAPAPV